MSDVKSITKSIRQKNKDLQELYLKKWEASEVRVTSTRLPINGNFRIESSVSSGSSSYQVTLAVQFMSGEELLILGKWYFIDSKQVFFENKDEKPEGIIETEKSLMENFVMDTQDLELL